MVSWLTAPESLPSGRRGVHWRNDMRKLTASELSKVAGGRNYDELLAKAWERYNSKHPSGSGLAVAATPPN